MIQMSKPQRKLLLVIAFISSTLLSSAPLSAYANQELLYGSWEPIHTPNSMAMPEFFEAVEAETDGQLSFRQFYGGSLINIRVGLIGIRDRLVDSANVAGGQTPANLPANYVFTNLAMLESSPLVMSAAVTETMLLDCPECLEETEQNNVVPLAYAASSPFYFQCREPIESSEDIAGMAVRAQSAFALFAQSLGAVPVNTSQGEVYQALQRGLVDCYIGGGFWLKSFGLWDITRYVIDAPLGQFPNGMIMGFNTNAWNDLPEQHKDAVIKNLPSLIYRSAMLSNQQEQLVRDESPSHKVTWAEPPTGFAEKLAEFRQNELKRVAQEGLDRGVEGVSDYIESLLKNLQKWQSILDETGGNEAAFIDALNEHIYNKISQ